MHDWKLRAALSTPALAIGGLPLIALLPTTPGASGREVLAFERASLIFEVNETDADAEIVLRIKGPEGLKEIELEGPDGNEVFELDVRGKAERKVGFQQFVIESGEPGIDEVRDTFPEGRYRLTGETLSGADVETTVQLSHSLVPAPSFAPVDGAKVPVDGAVIEWTPVMGADQYVIELEQDDLGYSLVVTLPASVSSFAIPDGFLLPDTEYDLGLATVAFNGNVAVAESSFSTQR